MNTLLLIRAYMTEHSTSGSLLYNDKKVCYTLEDVVRHDGAKVYGKTAIPAGEYEVVLTHSNRFQRIMPLLLRVPNFSGIRMHGGNNSKDTDACILVAHRRVDTDSVYGSAEKDVTALIDSIISGGNKCIIKIINAM